MNAEPHVTHLLNEYLDHELSPSDTIMVQRHLAGCAACRKELESLTSIVEGLQNLPKSIDPPEELIAAIDEQILASGSTTGKESAPAVFAFFNFPYRVAAMLMLAMISGLAVWFVLRTPQVTPPLAVDRIPSPISSAPTVRTDSAPPVLQSEQVPPQSSPEKPITDSRVPADAPSIVQKDENSQITEETISKEHGLTMAAPGSAGTMTQSTPALGKSESNGKGVIVGHVRDGSTGAPLPNATIILSGTTRGAAFDPDGRFSIIGVPVGTYSIRAEMIGYAAAQFTQVNVNADDTTRVDFALVPSAVEMGAPIVAEERPLTTRSATSSVGAGKSAQEPPAFSPPLSEFNRGFRGHGQSLSFSSERNTEQYDRIVENEFHDARSEPLSTFSIDVDAASYSNIRRFINDGRLPPRDAVRVEEMINYFTYEYPQPRNDHPFSITTEIARCPWNPSRDLLLVGLQGKQYDANELPPGNLVFLIDVSGSMKSPDKLPLVKSAFRLLVKSLRPQDRVSIVVYAGHAGLVLPPTSGDRKEDILSAIDRLEAGGSTAGGAGIQLAYDIARNYFLEEGNNRVILATDGDFNVGVSGDDELVELIEQKRDEGIFLSVLGFGTGNLKDSKMEKLADKGNGNYAYVDNILEARRVFVGQLAGTLFTIAKDVKIQIEFNPAAVSSYRLVGYENRMLAKEDFNDDRKDAGELGAGHTVTALYEIVRAGSADPSGSVDPLKYGDNPSNGKPANRYEDEIATVKLRYKAPESSVSKRLAVTVRRSSKSGSENVRFAAAVAEFGMILRDSKFKGSASFESVLALAREARGEDREGYRAEFIRLVETAMLLKEW